MDFQKNYEDYLEKNKVDKETGLESAAVAEKISRGEGNKSSAANGKTTKEILFSNIFTLFNILSTLLAVMVITTGEYMNMMFMLSIIINAIVGIYQELKVKNVLEKLSILKTNKVRVIRDRKEILIDKEGIVAGDIICLAKGMQAPVDAVCLEQGLFVDESLLTGESDVIGKSVGTMVYSGSLVTQGNAKAQVYSVGDNTYVSKLTAEARSFKNAKSKIQQYINNILKVIAVGIIPTAAVVFANQFIFSDILHIKNAILGTSAAVLGMMPEDLVLLTSVAFAAGVLKLSSMNILTQEMPTIETLARVDVICLDKTGTITQGKMRVEDTLYYESGEERIDDIISFIVGRDTEQNMSALALLEKFGGRGADYTMTARIPFSSETKLQAVQLEGLGTYILGAFDLIAGGISDKMREDIDGALKAGHRVIGLAHSASPIENGAAPKDAQIICLILIRDAIKEDARKIIDYFHSQGVAVKVISGDYPDTIAAIAKDVGISGSAVISADIPKDADLIRDVAEGNDIFGRVTPDQKRDIVSALQQNGHTVCMVGDGVNDILALKQADCAVAFENGSEATKAVGQFVLLDNDFGSLPEAVRQGRKVINNINTVAAMHIIRVVYSFLLPFLFLFFNVAYPLEPLNLSMVSLMTVALPTYLLVFEKNEKKADDSFFKNILTGSIPCGVIIALIVFIATLVHGVNFVGDTYIRTELTLLIGSVQLFALLLICRPLTKFRAIVVAAASASFYLSYFIPWVYSFFELEGFHMNAFVLVSGLTAFLLLAAVRAVLRGEILRSRNALRASKYFVGSAIAILALQSAFQLLLSFTDMYSGPPDDLMVIDQIGSRFFSLAFLLIIWNLRKRKFPAWVMAVGLLSLQILFDIGISILLSDFRPAIVIPLAAQVYCLIVLLMFYNYFHGSSNKPSSRAAAISFGAVMAILALSMTTGRTSIMDIMIFLFSVGGSTPYDKSVFVFTWMIFGISVLLLLRPALYRAFVLPHQIEKALRLVKKYGQNSSSYLAIEGDKNLFFGNIVEGVIAYGIVGDIIVVQADPICADENFTGFVSEFKAFCNRNGYKCLFMSTTGKFLEEYTSLGFDHVKYGEEALFRLEEYQLAGGKMAKMRADVNHATKAGITVFEYKPNEARDAEIEKAIKNCSDDWMGGKKSGQLVFTMGGINLKNPLDRRYFCAKDETGAIVAFNVYLPFAGMRGYMADVTRRTRNAPSGVTEKITFEAFMKFKEEGYIWGSLGISPLANIVDEDNTSKLVEKALTLVYEKGNQFYGFKALHRAKLKYSPTEWAPSYLVYTKGAMGVNMVMALVKVQNPGGVLDFAKSFLRDNLKKKIETKETPKHAGTGSVEG